MLHIINTLLDYLGYLGIGAKVKNRLYIVIGSIATLYLGYLTIRFFANGSYIRGIIYVLIFLVLVYFLILNFIFYFTDKIVKWDITQFILKYVKKKFPQMKHASSTVNGESDSILDNVAVLDLTIRNEDRFENMVESLLEENFFADNHYLENETNQKVYRINKDNLLPAYSIRHEEDQWKLFVGKDSLHKEYIAEITGVNGRSIKKEATIIPIKVGVLGGEFTILNNGLLEHFKEPYRLVVQARVENN